MDEATLTALFADVAAGRVSAENAAQRIRALPTEQVGNFAVLDTHRDVRTGFPEVVLCQGKTDDQIEAILGVLAQRSRCVLATRMTPATAARLETTDLGGTYDPTSRCYVIQPTPPAPVGLVVVCCAGTSDLPVAEEAAVTATVMGSRVERLYDVGVAGLHRLLGQVQVLQEAQAVVVVAGMEGALASVVGGLVSAPVIACPTSIGYGANFGGLAALLAMLNSCAAGVSVVNIDNGFSAGYSAHNINSRISRAAAGAEA